MKLSMRTIISFIGVAGVVLGLTGLLLPWVSVTNELYAGGTTGGDVTGWEMTEALVGSQIGYPGGPEFWANMVDELLVLTTKKSANFTPYVMLFGCVFMLALGLPLSYTKRLTAASVLLFVGSGIMLIGGVAGFTDYGMGRGTLLSPISGVTAVVQDTGYGVYMCIIGGMMGLACAAGVLWLRISEGGEWKKL